MDGAEVRRPAHVPRGQIGAGVMIHDYLSPRPTTPEDRPIRCDADRPRQPPRGYSAMAIVSLDWPFSRPRTCRQMNHKTTSSAALRIMRSGAMRSSKRSSNTLVEKRIEGGENKRSSNTLAEKRIEGGESGAAQADVCRFNSN